MRVTGWRSLTTTHDWGRLLGDAVPNHLSCEVQDCCWPLGLTVDQEIADGGTVLGDLPGLGIRVDDRRVEAARAADPPAATTGPHVRPDRAGPRLVPDR